MTERPTSIVLAANLLLREIQTKKRYRVVTPDGAGHYTMLIDIDDAKSWPFSETTERILQRLGQDEPDNTRLVIELDDPWSPSKLPPRPHYNKTKLQRDWDLIQHLISTPDAYRLMLAAHRNPILMKYAALNGTTRQRLSRMLKRYWKRGLRRDALLDDTHNSGGRGKRKTYSDQRAGRKFRDGRPGVPLTETVAKILNIAIDWYLEDPKKRTQQGALDRVAGLFSEMRKVTDRNGKTTLVGLDRKDQPTVRQFQNIMYTQRPYAVRKRAKLGAKAFELTGRAFRGRADQHVTGPGDAFVLDATVADIYLVSQFDRTLIVGRPTVYFSIDVFSRLITGVYIGYEPPSWTAASILLTNVVAPKVAWCAQYGIDITEEQWPSHFMSSTLFGDKAEMMAIRAGPLIVENLLVKVENAPAWRPDAKSIVESRFNIVPKKFAAFVPGYVEKDFDERGVRDYRLDAALTLYEFTQIIIWAILQHNSAPISDFPTAPDMVAAGKAPTPVELWEYGVRARSGTLRATTIDEVRRCVLPRATATVTHKGIQFKDDFYKCPTAVQGDWFAKAREATWRVSVAYDPRDLGLIWLCENGTFEECSPASTNPTDLDLRGKSLAERQNLKERNLDNVSDALDKHFLLRQEANSATDKIVANALAQKKEAMKTAGIKKLSTSDIREANAQERAAEQLGVASPNSSVASGAEDIVPQQEAKTDRAMSSHDESVDTKPVPERRTRENSADALPTLPVSPKARTLQMLKGLRGQR